MSERAIDKEYVVGALVEELAAIGGFLGNLPEAWWGSPTALPGWRVQDVVAHILGTEASLSGEALPTSEVDFRSLEYVRNDIGAANEAWVESLRQSPPAEVLSRFRELAARRSAALQAMSQAEFDAPSWTPVGRATYGRFMEIRVFDCWMHEQDMRDALALPGHAGGRCAELSVDEIVRALGYIVGKRAAAPAGSLVSFLLTGPVERSIQVLVGDRAIVVDSADRMPTTRLAMSSDVFARLAGGRVSVSSRLADIVVEGDAELGRLVLNALAFTI